VQFDERYQIRTMDLHRSIRFLHGIKHVLRNLLLHTRPGIDLVNAIIIVLKILAAWTVKLGTSRFEWFLIGARRSRPSGTMFERPAGGPI